MLHEISTPDLEPFPEFAVQKNDGEGAYLLALDESRRGDFSTARNTPGLSPTSHTRTPSANTQLQLPD